MSMMLPPEAPPAGMPPGLPPGPPPMAPPGDMGPTAPDMGGGGLPPELMAALGGGGMDSQMLDAEGQDPNAPPEDEGEPDTMSLLKEAMGLLMQAMKQEHDGGNADKAAGLAGMLQQGTKLQSAENKTMSSLRGALGG